MRRWQLLLIAILFMFGLGVELLKSFNIIKPTQGTRMSWGTVDFTPYAVSAPVGKKEIVDKFAKKRTGFRLSGGPAIGSYDLSEGHKVAEKAVAKNDEDEDKEKLKKKKARKARAKKKAEALAKIAELENFKESDDRKNRVQEKTPDNTSTAPIAVNPTPENNEPKTFEDWTGIVLSGPNAENVQLLVEAYKNGQITADVFYAVLNAMLATPNTAQHELAVEAAGFIPDAQSFLFLVQVIKTKPAGSVAHSLATQSLNNYRSIQFVGQLRSVLAMAFNDVVAVYFATQVLNQSTLNYLEQRSPTADNSNTDSNEFISGRSPELNNSAPTLNSGSALSKNRFANVYKGFDSLLEQIISSYGNQGEIVTNATSALTRIRAIPTNTLVAADF